MARHARRSQRRFANQPDLFDRGLFHFRRGRGSLFWLESFTPQRAFKELRTDLVKLAAASTICECFEKIVKEESGESAPLFALLETALEGVNQAAQSTESGRICFSTLAELLAVSGFNTPAAHQPSFRALMQLLDRVETISEKPLKSREALCTMLKLNSKGTALSRRA